MGLFDRLGQELDAQEKATGLRMADILSLPDDTRRLFNWMMRQEEVGLADVITFLGQDETNIRCTLLALVKGGYVREINSGNQVRYRVRLASKRKRDIPLNIWQALDDKIEE
jgi:hypothetical protein